jgi:hypothetical protein
MLDLFFLVVVERLGVSNSWFAMENSFFFVDLECYFECIAFDNSDIKKSNEWMCFSRIF